MNDERFQRLIEAVEATPEREFDLAGWVRKTPCGTVACAVGSYILRNPQCGLTPYFDQWALPRDTAQIKGDDGRVDWEAVWFHFDLSPRDAWWLFNDKAYKGNATKSVVLARLLKFFETHRTPSQAEKDAGFDRLLADLEAAPEQACMTGIHGCDDSYLDSDGQ